MPKQQSQLAKLLFICTLFISALLMFVLQPLFGKLLLPSLGGSPSVWNTCMLFYQGLLFLGYLYAHYCSRQPQRYQFYIHSALLLISLIALPVALPQDSLPPTEANPTLWLLGTLLFAIGLPFFVVSTTAPLMQKWFANLSHTDSHDPYFLYAASNTGSLLALLSYPFVIEPSLGLAQQTKFWSIGYILLLVLIISCIVLVWRTNHQSVTNDQKEIDHEPINLLRKLRWLVLAFVPSSLLLGLTTFISTDVASVPLLWVVPLSIYLLSFVIVFSRGGHVIHQPAVQLQAIVLLPFIAYSFLNPAVLPYWLDLSLHLLAFFLACMVCHGELAKDRPHTEFLTTYYLVMSFAGMLGGLFNTFIAPFIFNGVYEYPIMIVLALLLRPKQEAIENKTKYALVLDYLLPLILLIMGLILFSSKETLTAHIDEIGTALILLVGLCYAFRDRPIRLGLFTATILLFTQILHQAFSNNLYKERTFFGVSSVRESTLINEQGQPERYHELFHGTTKHGAQRLSNELQRTPLTYYSQPGPIGQLFSEFDKQNENWHVGIIGLGAGALSCYSKSEQTWTAFEIDPTVVEIARNPDYFTYISRCNPDLKIVMGDARLSLQQEQYQQYDLLIVDAFSSDAIPTHLLTEEAFELYFSKLKPEGLLAFHITNRHLTLKKVFADHAKQMNVAMLIQEFKPKEDIPLVVATDWIVAAQKERLLNPLKTSRLGYWEQLPLYFNAKTWTDDNTNIISVWKK